MKVPEGASYVEHWTKDTGPLPPTGVVGLVHCPVSSDPTKRVAPRAIDSARSGEPGGGVEGTPRSDVHDARAVRVPGVVVVEVALRGVCRRTDGACRACARARRHGSMGHRGRGCLHSEHAFTVHGGRGQGTCEVQTPRAGAALTCRSGAAEGGETGRDRPSRDGRSGMYSVAVACGQAIRHVEVTHNGAGSSRTSVRYQRREDGYLSSGRGPFTPSKRFPANSRRSGQNRTCVPNSLANGPSL